MPFHRLISNTLIRNQRSVFHQLVLVSRTNFRYAVGSLDQTSCLSVCTHQYSNKDSNVRVDDKTLKNDADEELNEPIRFSTSKAKDWSVDKSFGKNKKQGPVWKVALLSGTLLAIVAWLFVREETELDRMLERDIHKQLEERYPKYVAAGKEKR